jgi:hypothetical protein
MELYAASFTIPMQLKMRYVMGEPVMEDIVKSEEGKRFFEFLDTNWGLVYSLHHEQGNWNDIMIPARRTIYIAGEVFDQDLMIENEYQDILQYFLNMGTFY